VTAGKAEIFFGIPEKTICIPAMSGYTVIGGDAFPGNGND